MAEANNKIGQAQVSQIIIHFCDLKNHQPYGPDRKNKLGSLLVSNKVLQEETWAAINTEKDQSRFWNSLQEKLKQNQQTYEIIAEWMSYSDDVKATKLFKAKEVSIAEDILSAELKNTDATDDTFETFGFEVVDKAQFIYDALSGDINPGNGMENASDIKSKVKREWDQNAKFFENNPKVHDSSISWILHSVSNIFSVAIHVICLMTMEEVCFYPTKYILSSRHIFLGRCQPTKYIPLRKHDPDALCSSDFDKEVPDVKELIRQVEQLTIARDGARKQVEILRRQKNELENKIKVLKAGSSQQDVLQTQTEYADLQKEKSNLDSRLQGKVDELKEMKIKIQSLQNEIKRERARGKQLSQTVKDKEDQLKEAKGELQEVRNDLLDIKHKKREQKKKMKMKLRKLINGLSDDSDDSERAEYEPEEKETDGQLKAKIGVHIQVNSTDKIRSHVKKGQRNKKTKEHT